ncbi:MAG: hypothetical protein PUD59_04860 [bacterium]|nr:hypothetical protein [bacterium]
MYNSSYYKLNYLHESSEIDAKLNSILLFFKFCEKYKIELSEEDEHKTEIVFSELESKKTLKRYVGGNIIFNSYYLSLDEEFDFTIKEHPEWLE